MTDQQIVDLFHSRSEDAIAVLQAHYGAYCRAIVCRILPDRRDWEECLNDCWLSVWNAIPPAQPSHLKGWVGTIARNHALALCRRLNRQPEIVEETALELSQCLPACEDAYSTLQTKELGRAITEFLTAQKQSYRLAFLRRYWYFDSVQDISRQLGWSVSKTKSVLFRMRNRLRAYLLEEGFL